MRYLPTILTVSLLSFSSQATAQQAGAIPPALQQQMLEQAKKEIEADCSDQKILSCISFSKKQCVSISFEILDQCAYEKISKQAGFDMQKIEAAMQHCHKGVMVKNGLDPVKVEQCGQQQ